MTFYIDVKSSKGIRRIEVEAITSDEAEEKVKNLLGEAYFIESISTFKREQRS